MRIDIFEEMLHDRIEKNLPIQIRRHIFRDPVLAFAAAEAAHQRLLMMPEALIGQAAGVFGQPPAFTQIILPMVNGAAGARITGDLMVWKQESNAAGGAVLTNANNLVPVASTTTTANDQFVVGPIGNLAAGMVDVWPSGTPPLTGLLATGTASLVASDSFAVNAPMPVVIYGPARVNIGGQTIAAGDHVFTFTTLAQANSETTATLAHVGSYIGTAFETQAQKDSGNTIRMFVYKH